MASAEEWSTTAAQIRMEGGARRSPTMLRLYKLALADGPRMVASFAKAFGDERIADLIRDLLAEKADAIVNADAPQALFRTALVRRAISWRRRGDAAVVEAPPEDSTPNDTHGGGEGERRAFLLDARAALLRLPQRDREIVVAVALGDDREMLATRFGTSRANVDQIVSRAKRRFGKDDEP